MISAPPDEFHGSEVAFTVTELTDKLFGAETVNEVELVPIALVRPESEYVVHVTVHVPVFAFGIVLPA